MLVSFGKRFLFVLLLLLILFNLLQFITHWDRRSVVDLRRDDILKSIIRINKISEEIRKLSDEKYEIIPAFVNASNRVLAISSARVAICDTGENIGRNVLCDIENEENDEKECSSSIESFESIAHLATDYKTDQNLSNWKLIFARRDPFERVLDYYTTNCLKDYQNCFECDLDFQCFVSKIHENLKKMAKNEQVIGENDLPYIPQNWFCQMRAMSTRFTLLDYNSIRNESITKNIDYEMDTVGGDSLNQKIRAYLRKFIQSRENISNILNSIYYFDYVFLSLPIPYLKTDMVRDYHEGWN